MKHTRTLLVLSVLGLLIGSFVYASLSQSTLLAEQVKIEPKPFDLENPDGVSVYVKLTKDGVPVVEEIDPSTVLLEGFMTPISTSVTRRPPEFIAVFDGTMVALWVKVLISHMGITTPLPWVPVKITLRISGLLYDGTTWEGYGEIKVYVPDSSSPPPPPPP